MTTFVVDACCCLVRMLAVGVCDAGPPNHAAMRRPCAAHHHYKPPCRRCASSAPSPCDTPTPWRASASCAPSRCCAWTVAPACVTPAFAACSTPHQCRILVSPPPPHRRHHHHHHHQQQQQQQQQQPRTHTHAHPHAARTWTASPQPTSPQCPVCRCAPLRHPPSTRWACVAC